MRQAAARSDTATERIGLDLGGTKIEGLLIDAAGQEMSRLRVPSPQGDYRRTLEAIAHVVARLETEAGLSGIPVGLAIPGSISKRTGVVHNANSTWLNGRPLDKDLEQRLARPVRIANDANCFALSEATDGSGAGAASVFGVILGTGTGGGLVFRGQLIDGPLGIAGEWGHNPLPWAHGDEIPGPLCWCGRQGCMETWVSGPGLAADHERVTGSALSAEEIAQAAREGDEPALNTLARHQGRLARGLAHVANIFDPEVIVLGGGLSRLDHLYEVLPDLMRRFLFADAPVATIRPPRWGDASGVRGAAWLSGTP